MGNKGDQAHRRPPVPNVRGGSMRFLLLEGETLYSLTKQRSADAVTKPLK